MPDTQAPKRPRGRPRKPKAVSPYQGVAAKNLTEEERRFTEIKAAEGCSVRVAALRVWPEIAEYNGKDLHRFVTALSKRTRPYLQQLVEAGAEQASVSRATLIEMAMQDREFAYATGNAGAATAATKNIAALAGISMKDPGDGSQIEDFVTMLREVERVVRGAPADTLLDVTPGRNGRGQSE